MNNLQIARFISKHFLHNLLAIECMASWDDFIRNENELSCKDTIIQLNLCEVIGTGIRAHCSLSIKSTCIKISTEVIKLSV